MDSLFIVKNSSNTFSFYLEKITLFFLLLIILCFIIYFFVKLIQKTLNESNLIMKVYDFQLPKQGDGKNFLLCPLGCKRGICENKINNKDNCLFDFQCQYCEDRESGQFYVSSNYQNQFKIIPTYSQKEIRTDDFDILNEDIKKNNEYVRQLNLKIKDQNNINNLFVN